MPSLLSPGLALVPARGFVAGETVLRVNDCGPYVTLQTARGADNLRAVLSLSFKREKADKKCSKKSLPITGGSLLNYLRFLENETQTGPNWLKKAVVELVPVVTQSPYREPALVLEAAQDIAAYDGELAIRVVVATSGKRQNAGHVVLLCVSCLRQGNTSKNKEQTKPGSLQMFEILGIRVVYLF